jgi:phosphoenolpyruvate synthase/pyruvate phosphate dikinase
MVLIIRTPGDKSAFAFLNVAIYLKVMSIEKVSTADATIYLFSPIPEFFEQIYVETGLDFGEYCLVIKGTMAEEWIDQGAFRRCTFEILEREKSSPGYILRLIEASEKKKSLFLDFAEMLDNEDFEKLSDESMMGHFGTFLRLYRNQYVLSAIPFLYKEHLSEMLYERLAAKMGEKTAEILSYITTSERDSFFFEERKSMLKLMCAIYDSLGRELFEKEPEDILGILKKERPHIYEQLVDHARMYFWINNNYRRVFVLGPLDFAVKMKDESVSFKHPSEELSIMEDTKKNALQEKKGYLKLLDDEEKRMALLLSEGGWWQDERKKCNLIADHIMMKFLGDVSRRTNIPLEVLVNATTTEMGTILYGSADLEAIKKRHESEFTMYAKLRHQYTEVVMEPGRRYKESEIEKLHEFRGTPASLGKVEGEVVVITNEDDFGKMKEGAILVSVMTRPEYTPLMKKAKGIITDEGGLTCHAAIVSREFRIPCIVGTRMATRLLKDGDMVELDASKGVVKIK